MIAAGAHVPAVRVWRGPDDAVALDQLAPGRPFILLFYVLDWTGT